jgi:hypothetical protein
MHTEGLAAPPIAGVTRQEVDARPPHWLCLDRRKLAASTVRTKVAWSSGRSSALVPQIWPAAKLA